MKRFSFLLFISILFGSINANDTTATVAAGAIEYTKSPHISMDSEVLKISPEQIDIDYEFTNHSSQEITSQVVFPLPKSPVTLGDTFLIFPSWDDLFIAYNFIDQITEAAKLPPEEFFNHYRSLNGQVKYNAFSNFKLTVDGVEHSYNFQPHAIHADGRDITSLLLANDIPLSAAFVEGFMGEGHLIYRDPELKTKLRKLGLLNDKDRIQWQLQINYVWRQTFPSQKTIHVTHSYRPHPGQHWFTGKIGGSIKDIKLSHRDEIRPNQPEVKEIKNYCPTKADIVAIEAMFAPENIPKSEHKMDEVYYRAREVRYILTTGTNWKGPIKKFRLEIVPPSPSTIVLTCFPKPLQKNDQGIYIVELENFTPESDLKILFVDPSWR
ncbi:MAG: DUF4424 family protein [Janthinobacterium lividum]